MYKLVTFRHKKVNDKQEERGSKLYRSGLKTFYRQEIGFFYSFAHFYEDNKKKKTKTF